MTIDQAGLAARYRDMHQKGAQLYRDRSVKFFGGFGPELHNNLIAAAMLDGRSSARFESFLGYFKSLSNRASVFLVGRDFPTHVTIQQVVGSGALPNIALPQVVYGSIAFDTVIIDPAGNILLTATEVPSWLRSARTEIESATRAAGYEPANLSIVHMTVARLKSVSDVSFYNECLDAVHQWNREFGECPAPVVDQGSFCGFDSSSAWRGVKF